MTRYEYRVVPAPLRGAKVKGAKTTEARFAHTLMDLMNEMGREGWEYQRADTLPCEERVGLTGRTTRFQNMLVFRRAVEQPQQAAAAAPAARTEAPPAPDPGAGEAAAAGEPETAGSRMPLVAQRLAETLGKRPRATPVLRSVPTGGTAPRLGGATGQGMTRPEG